LLKLALTRMHYWDCTKVQIKNSTNDITIHVENVIIDPIPEYPY